MDNASSLELRVSFKSLGKIALAVILFGALQRLAPMLMLVFLASLLAVTLHPLVRRIERVLPRWAALLIVTVGLLGSTLFFAAVLLPSIAEQLGLVFAELPKLQSYIQERVPAHGLVHDLAGRAMGSSLLSDPGTWVARIVAIGTAALGGILQVGVLLIVSLYLLSDGPRAYSWLIAFFREPARGKVEQTTREMSQIIFAYIAGQVITSLLVFAYSFAVLSIFNVPAALALAGLASVFDILPIIGFFLAVIPAMALAITVSPWTALVVGLCYLGYHLLESYVLVPKIYGNRLRLSDLTVILGLLAADLLAGIPGAIAALPILAAYPIVERIWLVDMVGANVVEKHEEQAEKKGSAPAK